MSPPDLARRLLLRPMVLADAAPALALERSAFSGSWPATAFERELSHNGAARYLVLEDSAAGTMLGFGGLWLMVDEAHIVTVAVAPGERGKGYGKLIVHALVEVAMAHAMQVATLECRESNQVARRLYRGFGFYEVGLRKKYYSDNHEDAVIMTTEEFASPAYQRRWRGLTTALGHRFPGLARDLRVWSLVTAGEAVAREPR